MPPMDIGLKTPGHTPDRVIRRPVITEEREGEHTGDAEYIEVNRRPSRTMASMFGVSLVGLPAKEDRSP